MSINTQFILYKLQIVFFLFFGVITYAQKVDNVTLQTERDSHFTQSNPSFFHSHQETESGVLVNGFSIIKSKKGEYFTDINGKPISHKKFEEVRNFSEKRAAVKLNGKWGFIDDNGKVVIPFLYDQVYDFRAITTVVRENDKWFLIDNNGIILRTLDIDFFYGFKNGIAKVSRKNKEAFIDISGNILDEGWRNKFSNSLRQSIANNVNVCPPNIDFEEGSFNHWTCDTGIVRGLDGFTAAGIPTFYSVNGVSSTGSNEVILTVTPPMPDRHEIIRNLGGASPLDPYGGFPIYPPDGSNYAIKLGSDLDFPGATMPQGRAERASYVINVPNTTSDFSITYQYAVVFQDPGHIFPNQPRFTVKLFDPITNNYVPCGSVEYVADSTIPGFQLSPVGNDIWYKSWTPVFINLTQYAGRTLNLEFTTEDCAQGGHWGYAYVDVNGCNLSITAKNNCQVPPRTSLSGPPGFMNYNWWNANYTALLATGQQTILNPGLAFNATIHLEVIPESGASCRDTLTTQVTKDSLVYNNGFNSIICKDSIVTIGSGLTVPNCIYTWSPNSSIITNNQPTALVHPVATTDYFLIVTDTITFCKAYDTLNVFVNPKPVLITNVSSLCRGASELISVTGANNYTWSPATGLSATIGNAVTASPTVTTNYTITGFFSSTGCKSDTVITLNLYPKPTPNFIQPPAQCLNGNNFTFTSSSTISVGNIISYQWLFEGNQTAFGSVVNHHFPNAGIYNIKLITTSNNGCKDSIVKTIEVYPNPTVSVLANSPLSFCIGSNVQLTANVQSSSNIVSYQWSNSSGIITGATNATLSVNQSGDYHVTITNANGCSVSSSISQTIVNPLPQGILNLPSANFICEGGTLQLSTTSAAFNYQWYLNDAAIQGANQSTYNATIPGTYSLQLTSAQGCTNFATGGLNITIYKKPILNFTFPNRCERILIPFNNQSDTSLSGTVTWLWDFGDNSNSTSFSPIHYYTVGNNYTVILTATPVFCPALVATSQHVIHVDAPVPGIRYPAVDAVANINKLMHARSFASQYLWTPSAGLSSTVISSPYYNYDREMEYRIRLTTATGCVTTDTVLVRLQWAIDIQVPTGFTPNGDGHNDYLDVFLIGIGELKFFRVFNRWGQLLFETHNPAQLWDGSFKGKKQPAETYVWTAEGVGSDGKTVIRRGQTILIR